MGRADHVRYLLPNQINSRSRPILANRHGPARGPADDERPAAGPGRRCAAQCPAARASPPGPAREPVIRVFPAWPKEWDAAFTLLARGAFLVGSSMKAGKIESVRIESQAGGECRLRNPWPGATVDAGAQRPQGTRPVRRPAEVLNDQGRGDCDSSIEVIFGGLNMRPYRAPVTVRLLSIIACVVAFAAIDACAKDQGGTVLVPAGTFVIGTTAPYSWRSASSRARSCPSPMTIDCLAPRG